MELTRLFQPYTMGRVQLRNRLVFAGHGSRFVDPHDHTLTRRQALYLAERARGGVGLIIQGSGIAHPTGLTFGGINQVWDDSCIPAYAQVVDAVHEHGAAVFAQLSHLGRQGTGFPSHRELWAPSAIPDPASRVVPHAMTRADIEELVESYRQAARRYLAAGFDGLEVYLAHGYLLCSFLSRFSNTRTDEYGGALENRMRLPLRVLDAVRQVAGADVPVGIRISADEFVPQGLEIEESREIAARLLDAVQVDYVSVSHGTSSPTPPASWNARSHGSAWRCAAGSARGRTTCSRSHPTWSSSPRDRDRASRTSLARTSRTSRRRTWGSSPA